MSDVASESLVYSCILFHLETVDSESDSSEAENGFEDEDHGNGAFNSLTEGIPELTIRKKE